MAEATLTITDTEDGNFTIAADFGDKIEEASTAHNVAYQLLQGVLGTAGNYQQIEDTAGDLNGESAEPSRIITGVA